MRGCVAYKVNDSRGSRTIIDVDYIYTLLGDRWRAMKIEWNRIIPREQEQKN